MKLLNGKMRAEYAQGSWSFMDPSNPQNRVKFDQALMDATHVNRTHIEGYVRAVHGVDLEIAQYLDIRTKESLGIMAAHRLGRGQTLQRVRLMPDGTVEKVGYQ